MQIGDSVTLWRIGFFVGGLLGFSLLGLKHAYRRPGPGQAFRWVNNLALTFLNTILLRGLLPITLVALAHQVQTRDWGLFHLGTVPVALNVILSFFILDCVIYWQHVVFHHVPLLWRLHQVHHSDTGFDTTTGLRFHPFEILISVGVKAVAIVVLGVHPLGVIVFEVLLNFSAMFNHSNFSLPPAVERWVRRFVVTPDMHRIHHSVIQKETHSNFGFFLPWWDFLFKTYLANSSVDLRSGDIGVQRFRAPRDQGLDRLLLQPFKK
jgi:sterol desaturase/sphingolipid hydroxylase (fatty acid hydroxylase superfamily)